MKTMKKIIDADIIRIIKRGNEIDSDYKPQDVSRISYIEQDDDTYDIHYYDGGNCVHKEYSVCKDSLKKRFQWEASQHCSNMFSKYKILSYEIKYV
jgi:hypothetical protein